MINYRARFSLKDNYFASFINGITTRYHLVDDDSPIAPLKYPEFYDIHITDFCQGGCDFCYMNSTEGSRHAENAIEKIEEFFGPMTIFNISEFLNLVINKYDDIKITIQKLTKSINTNNYVYMDLLFKYLMTKGFKDKIITELKNYPENQKPFQVALGGGNPNQHPDFVNILKKFNELQIVPNYTTNGMGLTDKILEATQQYCGGVAVSCHPHLRKYWELGAKELSKAKIQLSYHHIIGDKNSVNRFIDIFENEKLDSLVSYHVLLPLIAQGRAKYSCDQNAKEKLFNYLEKLNPDRLQKIAFGAKFYDDLLEKKYNFPGISIYGPEDFSKFLYIKSMKIYGSSFEFEKGLPQ